MSHEDPVVVREMSVSITGFPGPLDGLRIAHVSDLHFRRWDRITRAAHSLLLATDYNLLAVTGDLADFRRNWRRSAELARRFFEPLAKRCRIYAVLGNHDHPCLAGADLPLRFLNNESVVLNHKGAPWLLAGVDQSTRSAENLDAALATDPSPGPTILLAHYPSTVFRLPQRRVRFVLSGHTHGGQIRLPGLGCLWTNDGIPRRMARGLHRVRGVAIHVSPGIGLSLPIRVRWNCPPEITVLILKTCNQSNAQATTLDEPQEVEMGA